MLESTSHLLLLGPDKLHFTDSVFHGGDGAPDRLEGRQQSMSKLFCSTIKNSCIFPGGGLLFSLYPPKSDMLYPTRRSWVILQIKNKLFYLQSDWEKKGGQFL